MASKAWDWSKANPDPWKVPDPRIVGLAWEWKGKGFHDVMDFGCGLGRHTLLFAEAGFHVLGFDLSQEAVRQTKALLQEAGFQGEIQEGDILNAPYPDECVDGLLSFHVISHTDKKGIVQVVHEIHRLLRSKGKFYVDLCAKESPFPANPAVRLLDENTIVSDAPGPEQGIPHYHASEEDIRFLFQDFDLLSLEHIRALVVDGKPSTRDHYYVHGRKR